MNTRQEESKIAAQQTAFYLLIFRPVSGIISRRVLWNGLAMRYTYNKAGGVVNGVIFFFEKGDEKIALRTFDVITRSDQKPTSIVWSGLCLEPLEIMRLLRTANIDSDGCLGVRFTLSESELLKSYLTFLRAAYPVLAPLTREIDSRVFGTVQ